MVGAAPMCCPLRASSASSASSCPARTPMRAAPTGAHLLHLHSEHRALSDLCLRCRKTTEEHPLDKVAAGCGCEWAEALQCWMLSMVARPADMAQTSKRAACMLAGHRSAAHSSACAHCEAAASLAWWSALPSSGCSLPGLLTACLNAAGLTQPAWQALLQQMRKALWGASLPQMGTMPHHLLQR